MTEMAGDDDSFMTDWLRIADGYRRPGTEDDHEFELPERSVPREIDLS
ncbi:MAG: hypothetical protein J7518_18850 [Nocardioidaceae bacterium]|nr:hypothetical protein [Nocardioidaceae bacterium]